MRSFLPVRPIFSIYSIELHAVFVASSILRLGSVQQLFSNEILSRSFVSSCLQEEEEEVHKNHHNNKKKKKQTKKKKTTRFASKIQF